jgi:ABC-type polysaccharide/polyol phosphate export permease
MSLESITLDAPVPLTRQPAIESEISFPQISQSQLAKQDFLGGLKKWRVWLMLSYQDIQLRYRRSVLGPFWLTLSMAITVYSMGYLYGHLFHTDLEAYFPFLVSGMLTWALISTLITESTDAFTASDGLIKQIKLPYTLYIHQVVFRNITIFFHNIVVIIPILAIYHEVAKINFYTLMLIPGLLIIYLNAFCYGLVLAIFGARYRDISQVIKSLIQVTFFVTPIMWNPNVLPAKDHYIVALNPFYAFVQVIRQPLIGAPPELSSFIMVGAITLIGIGICAFMFSKYRSRIIYWL